MKTINVPFIFIVEDDPFYREMVKNELYENDYQHIEVFSNGKDCLDNLYKMPDIVLLDYHLEDETDGFMILKKIKSFNPDTQVIMLSAQDQLEVAVNSMKYGAFDYVVKNDSAMQRIGQQVARICKWNEMLEKTKAFRKLKRNLVIAAGIALVLTIALVSTVL